MATNIVISLSAATYAPGSLVLILREKGEDSQRHFAGYSGVLQADAYGGYDALYESGRITEAVCMAHVRRKNP